jgi:STE24 endopeptidase
MSSYWFIIIVSLVLFNYLFSTVLNLINDKNWKSDIPSNMKEFYDEEKYNKARLYGKEKGRISFISSTISLALMLLMLFFEGFGYLNNIVLGFSDVPFVQTGMFFLILFVASDLLSLPFSWYNTFVIEEKYGFNKTTYKTFILDKLKGYSLTIIIGGGILYGAMYLIGYFETGFWFWLWLGMASLMLLINMFYADVIVPIFNKLTPLEQGALRTKIEEYSKKVGYELKNIFIIDGSKRSTKANAFFSGLGPRKTIALYDTLVDKHTDEELLAVLAHEVGHFKKKHVITSLLLTILQLGLMTWLIELCLKQQDISQALGASQMVFHLGIVAFGILYSPIGTILSLFMNIVSRKNEFEADAYAKKTSNAEDLILALKKLSVDSLSNLYPHPAYVFFHYSHPPLLKRLEKLS